MTDIEKKVVKTGGLYIMIDITSIVIAFISGVLICAACISAGFDMGRKTMEKEVKAKQSKPQASFDDEGDYIGDELIDGSEPEEEKRIATYDRKY